QSLAIPTVATVSWPTDQVLRGRVPAEQQAHDWIDPSAKVCLVEYTIPKSWCGKKVAEPHQPGPFSPPATARFGEAQVVGSGAVGQEGDVLYFVADVNALDALRRRLE